MHWRRKWQPTPLFLPRESQGWGSLVGCHLWGRTESDTTEATQQQQQQQQQAPAILYFLPFTLTFIVITYITTLLVLLEVITFHQMFY